MDWEAHRAHLLSTPAREGLTLLADSISAGSRPVRTKRLGGGLGSSTHAVDLETRSGSVLKLVLKRFATKESRSWCLLEWERLQFAQTLDVVSPEPVAVDADGSWFGSPALVMSRLEGRPHLSPTELDPWLEDIASALIAIQSAPTRPVPAALRRKHMASGWEPPPGLKRSPLVDQALEKIERDLPHALKAKKAVGHGDFHPGNLVWTKGRLSGIVDWSSTRVGPLAYEVAYMRADLCILHGADVAERFKEIYETLRGSRLGEDLVVWDLMCSLNAMRWGSLWTMAYNEQGKKGLGPRHVWPRAAGLIRSALRS